MSFNLNLNTTQEAFHVFTKLMALHGYRVTLVGYRVADDGQRRFIAEFTKVNPDEGLIICCFSYSQTSDILRVSWQNTRQSTNGNIRFKDIYKANGVINGFRSLMHDIFRPQAYV